MSDREKISVGLTGFSVEGKLSTMLFFAIIAALLFAAYATGQLSVIYKACFGLRQF